MTKHSTSLSFLVFAGLSLAGVSASAQPVAPAIQALLSPRRTENRIRAARAIAHQHPDGGRQALERTLEDTSNAPRVRAAVATALGELGDTVAISTLNRHASDNNTHVQTAVHSALDRLRAGNTTVVGNGALVTAPPPPPTDWRRVTAAVSIGTIVHHAPEANAFNAAFRSALEHELAMQRGVGYLPAHPPREAEARIAHGGLRRFSLEGGVARLRQWQTGATIEVRAEVSLLVISEPSHSIVGTIDGSATASDSVPTVGAGPDTARITQRAIDGALHSSLGRLSENLNGAPSSHRHEHH